MNITINHQDGLELLRSLEKGSVDLILTDPPYVTSRQSGMQKWYEKTKNNTHEAKTESEWLNLKTLTEWKQFLRKGKVARGKRKKKLQECREKFKQLRYIEWIKTNPVPINSKVNYLTNAREIALTAIKKSKPTFNSKYDNGIYKYPIQGGKNRTHPTQKNLKLFEELITKHSNEGELVLDCFLGGGTTAIASFNTGRSFIGCEREKEHYDNSIDWLEREGNE
jgi:site-specific DNA-methyltransferase (adenine-specific)